MQTNNLSFGECIFLGIAVMVVLVLSSFLGAELAIKDISSDKKSDTCITIMQKAIPDPNDDGRMSFLKDCYEVK